MAKLNLYEDDQGNEYVVIITDTRFEEELNIDYKLIERVSLVGDFMLWPTDRMLQEC